MKRLVITCVLLIGCFRAIYAADSTRHVVIISLDGCTPALMQDDLVPHLRSLWTGGSYSWSAQTVSPSVTLNAHASMLTGMLPAKHGVNWNDYTPGKEEIAVPTLFDLAHKAGLQTAFIGSKRKLRHLNRPGTANASAFPRTELQETGIDPRTSPASAVPVFDTVKAVRDCFGQVQPNLCFVHFAQPDMTGHRFGWESDEIRYTIRQVDQQIGLLLAFFKRAGHLENTLIIVTSDHGGHKNTHGTDSAADMTIPWVAWGTRIKKNHQIESPIRIADTAATAAFYLKLKIPKTWDGEVVTEVFR